MELESLLGWLPAPGTLDVVLLSLFAGPVLLLGIPVLRATIRMPMRMEIETDVEVPPSVGEFFARIESRLRTEGYNPVVTFTATNLPGHNINRAYISAGDPAIAMATVGISDQENVAIGARYLEFVSEFADGTEVTTRSVAAEDPFDAMPGHHKFVHTRVSDPVALKHLHTAHCEPFLVKGPVHCPPDGFLDKLREFHQRWVTFQAGRGLLRKLPGNEEEVGASTKLAIRGIATFFNPFAEGFTVDRLLFALAFGIVAPVLALAALHLPEVPFVPNVAEATGLDPSLVFMLAATPVLLTAAAAVGWIFKGNALLWGFLAAYTSSRMLLPDLTDDLARLVWLGTLFSAPLVAQRVETFLTRRDSGSGTGSGS